ncbi:MAG: MscL family protein [Actinomycetota bacterium]|nr:MscL family protein [Actinomycetota bacterium]
MLIGVAFGQVIASLVANVLTPIVAIPGSAPDFSSLVLTVGGSDIRYGTFINDLIAFLLVAVAIFLFVIKPMNALMSRVNDNPAPAPDTKTCPECLSVIPVKAGRCMFCTIPQTTDA